MPNRFIKECCRSSPTLHKLTNFQERLFWRLLTVADDYGRFEANASVIKNTCFPLGCKETITDVKICMQILADSNTLILYEKDGREYGQFVNFISYQGEPRAKKSKHPEPPQPVDSEHLQTSANICEQMLPSSVSESVSDVNLSNSNSFPPLPPKGHGARKTLYPTKAEIQKQEIEVAQDIFAVMNQRAGLNFQASHPNGDPTNHVTFVAALLRKGYTKDQLRRVALHQHTFWSQREDGATFIRDYFRPETLFNDTKFAGYVAKLPPLEPLKQDGGDHA